MVFLRTKKINGNLYCYLVQNKHTKKGSRQKVKKYLGRAIEFEQKKEADFFKVNPDYRSKKSKKEVLKNLIKFELIKHNFKEKDDFLVNKKINFNKNDFKISKNTREVLLSLNEGFLCSFTIKRILNFKKTNDFQKDAYTLAKYFVEAGIKIPQEIFVDYYKKC